MTFILNNSFSRRYRKIKEIGNGSYGNVYEIEHCISKRIYACKEIKLSDEIEFCLYNELISRCVFDHPSIIKIHSVFCETEGKNHICRIIMDKCDNSLGNILIKNKTKLDMETKLKYLNQLIAGLMHMEQMGYIHNDLSLTNIMIKDDNIKIIDFGFMYKKTITHRRTNSITEYVQPPELISRSNKFFDISKIDIWSLGIVFYAMCYNELLIGWSSKCDYLLDLISVACPSVSILKKYRIETKYLDLFHRIIPTDKIKHEPVETILTESHLQKLVIFNNKSHPNKLSNLTAKTPENKFIKKLINWNYNKRPNITQVYHLYNKLFLLEGLSAQGEPTAKFPKNDFLLEPPISNLDAFNTRDLWLHVLNHLFLFRPTYLFRIHFDEKILKNSLNSSNSYHMMVKTLFLMAQLWKNCSSNYLVQSYLNKILYIPEENKLTSILGKIETSIDRFYLLTNIIFHRDNLFEEYLLHEKSIQIENTSRWQYIVINLLNCKIALDDSFDVFIKNKINKSHQNQFKFLYYFLLSNPATILLSHEDVFEGLMILIGGYRDEHIRCKIKFEFKNITDIINFTSARSTAMPGVPNCKNNYLPTRLDNSKYQINNYAIKISSVFMAYYIVWMIKKLKIYFSVCATHFNIGKRFCAYIDSLSC